MLINIKHRKMPKFKNIIDIISNPWSSDFSLENSVSYLPSSAPWNLDKEIKLDDVLIWEQLHYEPGNIGVYAAYNPYAEFYLITYNLFFKTEFKFETFYGVDAAQQCYDRATELGIYLSFS